MSHKYSRLFLGIVLLISCNSLFSQSISNTGGLISDSLKAVQKVQIENGKKPPIVLNEKESMELLRKKLNSPTWDSAGGKLRLALEYLVFEASHPVFDSARVFLDKYKFDSITIADSVWSDVTSVATIITSNKNLTGDSILLVTVDTLNNWTQKDQGSPLNRSGILIGEDSLQVAVKSLLNYLETRDSSVISFRGQANERVDLRMNSRSDNMIRYWLKNEFSDSVIVWINNPERNVIELILEKGVVFRRPGRQSNYADAKIDIKAPDNSKLLNLRVVKIKKPYWKYRSESSFTLSQAALSNWVKGGENSISTAFDVTGYGDYNNTDKKLSSNNFIRLKLGFLKSGDNGVRKNIDLLETNSKLNHKAFGKFDFSAIMLFKSQVAHGNTYSKTKSGEDTTILVSKFMNPAILTIGIGLDYKPDKSTSLNFSPLSYKGTFVPASGKYDETSPIPEGKIDQTKYGIPVGKKALNEPGVSFMISNEYKPAKNVTLTNRLQLFTNYIHNPQNVDIDWEMIAVVNLNWFTDVRFNTHMIFDDDTKTVELDKNKTPKLRPDGSLIKTARVQFKEILGFTLSFRF
jgi:hypothetical protein